MGVDRTDYIMLGWKLSYEKYDRDFYEDESLLPYIEEWEEIKYRLIIDGMSGEYIVFGYELMRGGDEWAGWEFEEINFDEIDIEKLKLECKRIFGDILEEPKLFIFSHFS